MRSAFARLHPGDSSANNSTVAVVMQVSSLDFNADAGFHFIVLVDDTGETVNQDTAVAVDGRYEFQFNNVAPGRFRLAAGESVDRLIEPIRIAPPRPRELAE